MQATATELKGQRVKLTQTDDTEVYGVLRGVTSEKIWINEVGIPVGDIAGIEPAPLVCSNCHRSVLRLFAETGEPLVARTDGFCADCYRRAAARRPAHQEPCVVCGAPGIRNPNSREKEFLCVVHHAKTGRGLAVHPSVPVIAECSTEDVTSDKHVWGQVRGSRFRCIRCKRAEKWDPELLAEMMKDQL